MLSVNKNIRHSHVCASGDKARGAALSMFINIDSINRSDSGHEGRSLCRDRGVVSEDNSKKCNNDKEMDEMKQRVNKQAHVATEMCTDLHNCNHMVERIEKEYKARFKRKTNLDSTG